MITSAAIRKAADQPDNIADVDALKVANRRALKAMADNPAAAASAAWMPEQLLENRRDSQKAGA